MTEVPKIVYDRLRAAQPERAHPPADLLTAFAEQALSATERDGVLEHLARCGDCRETIALALPAAADLTAAASDNVEDVEAATARAGARTASRPIFAWPHLRWAALAAGIAVAGSVLLLFPGRQNQSQSVKQPNQPSTNAQVAQAVPPTPAPHSADSSADSLAASPSTEHSEILNQTSATRTGQSALSSTAQLAVPAPHKTGPPVVLPPIASPAATAQAPMTMAGTIAGRTTGAMTGAMTGSKPDNSRSKSEFSYDSKSESKMSRPLDAGAAAMPAIHVKSEVMIADNTVAGNPKDSPNKQSATLPQAARALNQDASAAPGTTETIAVSGAAVAAQKPPNAGDILMAQNSAPAIVKAKEPSPGISGNEHSRNESSKGETVSAAGSAPVQGRNVMSLAKLGASSGSAVTRPATWTIAAGVLQRSLDNGRTWQVSLRPDRPLLCSASHDADVWAGGQAGTLFHSTNNGLTWVQVRPTLKDQQLSSDITHIDVPSATQIAVSTSSNEVWSSADAGKTWDKK